MTEDASTKHKTLTDLQSLMQLDATRDALPAASEDRDLAGKQAAGPGIPPDGGAEAATPPSHPASGICPQTETLRAALAYSAAYGLRDAAPVAALSAPGDALQFVHDQIAGLILARQAVFTADTRPLFACEVAGARLLRFATLDQSGTATAEWGFDDLSDAPAVAETLERLRQHILSGCAETSQISVKIEPLAQAVGPGQGGVTADQVCSAFALDTPPGTAPGMAMETFNRFIALCDAQIIAAAALEGELLYALTGEDADIDLLAGHLEGVLPDLQDLPGGLSGPLSRGGMIILDPDGSTGPQLLAASHDDWMLFARVIPNAQPVLLRAWYAACCQ